MALTGLREGNVANAQRALAARGVHAEVSFRPEDCAYLTGRRAFIYRVIAEGRSGEAVYLAVDGPPVILCMADYVAFYRSVGVIARPISDLVSILAESRLNDNRVVVAADAPHRDWLAVAEVLGDRLISDVDPIIEARRIKTAAEIGALRRTAAVAEAGMGAVLGACRTGVTEAQAAAAGEAVMRALGAEAFAFSSIVTSGPEAGLMRETTTNRTLKDGDWVLADLGCSVDGYNVEFARSVPVGTASARFRAAYAATLAAQVAAIELARPGARTGDLDAAAHDSLRASGFEQVGYQHITGHGIGTGVWEAPSIGSGSDERLVAGNVFTIEPSIVSPGEGTLRIEDLVLVTDDGFELLTEFPVLADADRLGRPLTPSVSLGPSR